jgi:hypothetical protein
MTTATPAQDLSNHRKVVPMYHYVASPILLINLVYSGYVAVTSFSVASIIGLLVAFALIVVSLYARLFALGAQDRVIRLEERLRLGELLAPDQQDSIGELTTAQLIGLRFASDGEVADLVAAVRSEGIKNRDEIKKRVKNWRPDSQQL